ncbi:MAG: carbonic anhydrase [Bacteroidetes bacterium]|nr:MAG: carbonic anhydrase [Bacteroidota bacterium]
MITQTKETRSALTPEMALKILKAGNKRFVDGESIPRDLLKQVVETTGGQFPFAVILSCIDSRVSSELIFDQGVGDIFSVRVAGNVINTDVLGSIEFACNVAGAKLILVLGHTRCGAIQGACEGVEFGNLTELLAKIKPAIDDVKASHGNNHTVNMEFINKVAQTNVMQILDQIKDESPVLKGMINKGEVLLSGAMYSVETGSVELL